MVDCGASYAFSCHDCFVHNVSKSGGTELWRARHGSKITATPQLVKIEKDDRLDSYQICRHIQGPEIRYADFVKQQPGRARQNS